MSDGFVAEYEIIGTLDLFPRFITNSACIEETGPMIATTSTFFRRSKAALMVE